MKSQLDKNFEVQYLKELPRLTLIQHHLFCLGLRPQFNLQVQPCEFFAELSRRYVLCWKYFDHFLWVIRQGCLTGCPQNITYPASANII